jgi:branched-chain amino acid aminotransferase
VEELGGMNLFFVMRDGNLITPPLNGTILPGITRESIIELALERGMSVIERRYSIDDWRTDAATGVLAEVFACGTAATVVGVGSVRTRNGDFSIGDGSTGPATIMLCHELLGVQRGEVPDPREWTFKVGSPPGLVCRP